MRNLSSTLTTASKELSSSPIWKVILSRQSQTTKGYDQARITKITHTETPDGDNAEITLENADGALTALDFEHYQAVISYGYNTGIARSAWVAGSTYAVDAVVRPVTANGYQYRCAVAGTVAGTTEPTWPTDLGVRVADSSVTWEADGNSGEEYSRTSPLRQRVQELHSGRGVMKVILRPEGIFNQLKEDKAKAETTLVVADTSTVQSLINAIAGTTLAPYGGYTAYTTTYDSTDSLIGSFKPAEYFSVKENESRYQKIEQLLAWTGSKMRAEADGAIHFQDPTTSGTAYNYEYKWNVQGDHLFWNKSIRLRFVEPNEVIVKSADDHSPSYAGTATSTPSYDLAPKTQTLRARLTSTAEASSIASAMIERYELNAEKGAVVVPMNVGQELWDYVKVTDDLSGDTRIGNIQFIQREVEIFKDGRPLTWRMICSFGKLASLSLSSLLLVSGGEAARLSNDQILRLFDAIADRLDILNTDLTTLWDKVNSPTNIYATVAQTSAGLLTQKAVTPNSLAASERGERIIEIPLNAGTALTTSDKAYGRIPSTMNGWKLIAVAAMVKGASSSGAVTLTVKNGATSMLSTNITIDVSEYDTLTAATPAVIDAAEDDIVTGDQIEVACTGAGTGVTYCVVELIFIDQV